MFRILHLASVRFGQKREEYVSFYKMEFSQLYNKLNPNCLQRYKKSFLWFNQDRSEVSSSSILTSDLCSEHTFLFCYRNCHHGLKWHTTVEQNRFSVHTNTIIHGRSLFPGSSCEPLLPPLAISTNKHLFPRSVQNRSRKHTIISKNWNRFLLN